MLSHQAIMYMGGNMAELRNITPDDVFYNIAPLSHVIGLGAMLTTAIWAGGTTELVTPVSPRQFRGCAQGQPYHLCDGCPD